MRCLFRCSVFAAKPRHWSRGMSWRNVYKDFVENTLGNWSINSLRSCHWSDISFSPMYIPTHLSRYVGTSAKTETKGNSSKLGSKRRIWSMGLNFLGWVGPLYTVLCSAGACSSWQMIDCWIAPGSLLQIEALKGVNPVKPRSVLWWEIGLRAVVS